MSARNKYCFLILNFIKNKNEKVKFLTFDLETNFRQIFHKYL